MYTMPQHLGSVGILTVASSIYPQEVTNKAKICFWVYAEIVAMCTVKLTTLCMYRVPTPPCYQGVSWIVFLKQISQSPSPLPDKRHKKYIYPDQVRKECKNYRQDFHTLIIHSFCDSDSSRF